MSTHHSKSLTTAEPAPGYDPSPPSYSASEPHCISIPEPATIPSDPHSTTPTAENLENWEKELVRRERDILKRELAIAKESPFAYFSYLSLPFNFACFVIVVFCLARTRSLEFCHGKSFQSNFLTVIPIFAFPKLLETILTGAETPLHPNPGYKYSVRALVNVFSLFFGVAWVRWTHVLC